MRALELGVDLRLPGRALGDAHEVGPRLLVESAAPRSALIAIDARAVVELPLAGPPRLLARAFDRALFEVQAPEGRGIVVVDAAGTATARAAHDPDGAYLGLDGGSFLVVPRVGDVRTIVLCGPDGAPRVALPRAFEPGARTMPPPRRFAGGWLVSNLVDDAGQRQSFTLFDARFETAAFSADLPGDRAATPLGWNVFLATLEGHAELWRRDGRDLVRIAERRARAAWRLADLVVIDDGDGALVALDQRGDVRFERSAPRGGSLRAGLLRRGLLVHGDDEAVLLAPDGAVLEERALEAPAELRAGMNGTGYLRSGGELLVLGDATRAVRIGTGAVLEAIAGDDLVVRVGERAFALVDCVGERATFESDAAIVRGGRGGPYLVDAERVRIARFAPR